jgi:hypothetical protein
MDDILASRAYGGKGIKARAKFSEIFFSRLVNKLVCTVFAVFTGFRGSDVHPDARTITEREIDNVSVSALILVLVPVFG